MKAHTVRRFFSVGLFAATLVGLAGPARGGDAPPADPASGGAPAADAPAAAAKDASTSALHPDRAFGELYDALPFGGDVDAVTTFERERVRKVYRMRMVATPDVARRDRLRAEAEEEVEEFSRSHVEFRGQPTGYDVSILSGDFRHRARQAMRLRIDDVGRSYFLFSEGTLWKALRQIPAAAQPFDQVLAAMKAAYGEPARVETRTVMDGETAAPRIEKAVWEDGILTVTAEDRSDVYKAYVLRWALTDVESRVSAIARPDAGGDARRGTEDILREVMTPEDDPSAVSDIVDRLLERGGTKPAPAPAPVAPRE